MTLQCLVSSPVPQWHVPAIPHRRPEVTKMLRRDVSCPEFSGYLFTLAGEEGTYLQRIEQFMSEDITSSQSLTLEMFKGFNETDSASIQAQG